MAFEELLDLSRKGSGRRRPPQLDLLVLFRVIAHHESGEGQKRRFQVLLEVDATGRVTGMAALRAIQGHIISFIVYSRLIKTIPKDLLTLVGPVIHRTTEDALPGIPVGHTPRRRRR